MSSEYHVLCLAQARTELTGSPVLCSTEKIPGMFGTMVIALPSIHEGGEVILKHRTLTQTYASSKFRQSFAYWYSNVEHEVKPVKSRYRLVLTYNLALRGSNTVPRIQDATVTPVNQALQEWRRQIDAREVDKSPLIYLTDHKYSQAFLSERNLKGSDRGKLQILRQAAEAYGFDVLLTTLEHTRF